jgi:hypothetical protein
MNSSRKTKIVVIFALRLGSVRLYTPTIKIYVTNAPSRSIPLSTIRVINLSTTLHSPQYNFSLAPIEVLTQAEMCYNILSATLPSLSSFLASAHTGLLELGGTDKMASTYGSASRSRRTGESGGKSKNQQSGSSALKVEAFELTEQMHGRGTSSAVTVDKSKARRDSLSSDDSERAIIRVQRTVSLRYER